AAARDRLLARGLDAAAADDVLAATHCTPPPAYLILNSGLIMGNAWRDLGSFDPRRAFAVSAGQARGVRAPAAALQRAFGMPGPEARALAERAATVRTPAEANAFTSQRLGSLYPAWLPCGDTGSQGWTCPVRQPIDGVGTVLDAVNFEPDAPAASRLRL